MVKLTRMVLRAMKDAADDDILSNNAEEYFVGKAVREHAPKTTVISWKSFGIGLKTQ